MTIHGSFMLRKRSQTPRPSLIAPTSAMTAPAKVRNQLPVVSTRLLTVEFDLSRLRSFLLDVVPRNCPKDYNLICDAYNFFNAVNIKVVDGRMTRKGDSSRLLNESFYCNKCHVELNNCGTVITRFLSSWTVSPTSQTLSEAHFLIGCINETLQETHQAKKSYITALWIIIAKLDVHMPTEALATTLHCLGRTYSALDQNKMAKNILRKAQQQYMLLNVHQDHAVMIDVRRLISYNDKSRADQLNAAKHWYSSSSISISFDSTLELLFNEDEIE
jgi:hypothetical protein